MSTIAALTEDFTGGAVNAPVTAANTMFDSVSGTGTSTIIVDPYDSSLRMMQVVTSASSRFHARSFTGEELLWFPFEVDITSVPTATTAILQGFASSAATTAEKVFDLRVMAGTRTIQLRNATSAGLWTSTTLAAGTKHRVWVFAKQGATASARRLRVVVCSGSPYTTITQDSGELTSNTAVSTIGHLKLGILTDTAASINFGRLRGDNATGPTVSVPATVTLGADQTGIEPGATVSLTANTTGGAGGAVSFTQTAGPTVALSGTGSTRTFTAPAYWGSGQTAPTGPVLTFQATYGAATATVNVTPYPHLRWRKGASGWQPVYPQRRST